MSIAIGMKPQGEALHLYDTKTGYPVLWGGTFSVSYTLQSDDITVWERPHECTPFESRRGEFTRLEQQGEGYRLCTEDEKTALTVTPFGEGLQLEMTTWRQDYSHFGLNLPFNFMGKLQGGGYENQYLFNSPYRSADEQHKYCLMKNINGNHLLVLFLSQADGWKMDYSPYVGGHYFVSLQCCANFDRAYGTGSHRQSIRLALLPVKSAKEAVQKAAELLGVPGLWYEESYTLTGQGTVQVFGPCDYVQLGDKKLLPQNGYVTYTGVTGKTLLTPVYQGKKGLDCSVFGYGNIFDRYKKANDVIAVWDGLPNLGNACECQCWAGAMLKYMLRFGRVQAYDEKLREFFRVFLGKREADAVVRLTVYPEAQGEFGPYSVYKSHRIQEHSFAVSMLLDAYKLYGQEKFLTYAVGAMNNIIANYQKENGALMTPHGGEYTDYSTVCCLIIPMVDMALFMKDRDESLYQTCRNAAGKLAEHIFRRGFSFPTEGGGTMEAEEQMEDGSISCSALALLYYCAKIERREDYIAQAKAFLDFHENWVIETPDANMFRSSLRWWETRWEGDGDGPALCCGHAWTIWRSEADYWYYKLTGDASYWRKALCGFAANFAKFDAQGHGKSIYNADYITGGGFGGKEAVRWRIAPRLPDREDVKTARYAWLRAADSIFQEL